jgi:hypothetical protein
MTQHSEKPLAKLRWFKSRVKKRWMSSRTSLAFASILGSTKELPPRGVLLELAAQIFTRVWPGDALDRALNYRKALRQATWHSRGNDAGVGRPGSRRPRQDHVVAQISKSKRIVGGIMRSLATYDLAWLWSELGIPERRV